MQGGNRWCGFLDVEMTHDQLEVIRLKSIDRMLMEAMKDAGGQGAMTKLAKQKLDMFGNVNSRYSMMVNDETKLNLLRSKLQLAAPIEAVYRMDKADTQAKKHAERRRMRSLLKNKVKFQSSPRRRPRPSFMLTSMLTMFL